MWRRSLCQTAPVMVGCYFPSPVGVVGAVQTNSTLAANQYMASGADHAFNLTTFKKGFSIKITKYQGTDMEFEMKGASCAVRRCCCCRLGGGGVALWRKCPVVTYTPAATPCSWPTPCGAS